MSRRQQHGWSLVELAVVLVIVAIIGLVLARSLPVAGQLADDAQHRVGADEQRLALHVGHGLERVGGQAEPGQDRLTLGGLHRAEAEAPLAVVADQELRPAVAQPAHAIEQHDALAGLDMGW